MGLYCHCTVKEWCQGPNEMRWSLPGGVSFPATFPVYSEVDERVDPHWLTSPGESRPLTAIRPQKGI